MNTNGKSVRRLCQADAFKLGSIWAKYLSRDPVSQRWFWVDGMTDLKSMGECPSGNVVDVRTIVYARRRAGYRLVSEGNGIARGNGRASEKIAALEHGLELLGQRIAKLEQYR